MKKIGIKTREMKRFGKNGKEEKAWKSKRKYVSPKK